MTAVIADQTLTEALADANYTGTTEAWRAERLAAAGFSDRTALKLAFNRDVDMHLACDLLAKGCPVRTAVRIVS